MQLRSRRGVASVVGTVFFILIFMLALGSLAYASGLQAQSSAVRDSAVQVASQRGAEDLVYVRQGSALYVTNEGPSTSDLNHIILKFPNGTVYAPAVKAALPTGGALSVQSLVPLGTCLPGTATCLSKYSQIVSGNPPGSEVGMVTSLGNVFWYAYQSSQVTWSSVTGFPAACPTGESISQLGSSPTCVAGGGIDSWAKATATTSGTNKYSSTGLVVVLPANGTYGFFVFTAMEPTIGIEGYNFEVHALPAGASLTIACAPLSYPEGGGNNPTNCVSSAGVPIAELSNLQFGTSPPVYETPGIFGVVKMGTTGGNLQIDFSCTANCGSVSLKAGSFMVVQPLG
jgi:hypothetical protein